MKKTLLLAISFLMAISAMAGTDDMFRKGNNQWSFNGQTFNDDNEYTRRPGFLLHLGFSNGASIGAGYQFNPHIQAYGDVGTGGYTIGGRYYANEKKWSFMADLSLGVVNYTELNEGITITSAFGGKGIVGASYKSFDFGVGAWVSPIGFSLAIMADWNIRFGRD